MKHFFATGNGGSGTRIYAFETKKDRDNFVAWNVGFDQRRSVSRDQARQYNKTALLMRDGELVPDGYGPTEVELA